MKVAVVGLGHMGMGMAKNLLKGGHEVTAFDLSASAIETANKDGLTTTASGREAVANVEVVITVLPAGKHVLSAYRGQHGNDGLLAAAKKGTLFMVAPRSEWTRGARPPIWHVRQAIAAWTLRSPAGWLARMKERSLS